ncbi:MAG: AmmeMemoRadiSam system protein B [Candidatus Cryosericum sp.]|nr:AmmeMemoRadiSam system protein B [Candidatus Cryosericum sp.]HPS69505.1 AmmeMemoRadiSam system protein B [Candidatus Cryosericum sp.]
MIRHAVVAGQFYPADSRELREVVHQYLEPCVTGRPASGGVRGLVVPHAGYIYSGPVAGAGYACLGCSDSPGNPTVVILAPSHHVWFRGAALPEADTFRTPLGDVGISPAASVLAASPPVFVSSQAHALEHAVEVQLPFLQVCFSSFTILPLVLGDVDTDELADAILALGLQNMLVVASSDLSHYEPYDDAVVHDHTTIQHILDGRGDLLEGDDACGFLAIRTLLALAQRSGWKPELVDYRNSGDTAGDKSAVVGYASIAFRGGRDGNE